MGDEQIRQAQLITQVEQELQQLGLHGDVERAGDFVADDELGVERQRAGDADALTLPAGELMRVAAQHGGVQLDSAHDVCGQVLPAGFAVAQAVHLHDLGQHAADGEPRIERGVRVLEDDLHVTPHRAQLGRAQADQLPAFKHGAA